MMPVLIHLGEQSVFLKLVGEEEEATHHAHGLAEHLHGQLREVRTMHVYPDHDHVVVEWRTRAHMCEQWLHVLEILLQHHIPVRGIACT